MPQPFNTLHVDLGKQWRGGQNQAFLLMQGLRALGHIAELAARADSPLALRARAAGIPVHGLAKLLDRRPAYQIVHCHCARSLTAAWAARVHHRAAVVAARRVAYPLNQNRVALARYRSARRIVAVSRFVAQSVIASGIPSELVDVVYDGVDLAPPQPHRTPAENSPVLGCVGYLLPEKNQGLLIRALPIIREQYPNCRLLLAGDGPSRPSLERLANETGVAAMVQFLGVVENVAQVYAALDVFLFPSLAEPLGSSLLAAMSHGLPAVAIAAGAVPEIITTETNGLLIPHPDPEAFAHAVLRLLRDPLLAARLGDAARHTVTQQFSAARMVQDTLDFYGRILAP